MKGNMKILGIILGIGILVFGGTNYSFAAEFPTKPITLINPFSPGGSAHLNLRIWAKHLGQILKQPVAVENRVGGGGVVGYSALAKAPADGYTLGYCANSMIFKYLAIPKCVYTPESFAPIAHGNSEPHKIIIKTGSKLDIPADKLFNHLKQHPNEFTAGTAGRWGAIHFATELLESVTGIKFRKVNFTGSGPAITNLLGGHVDVVFSFYSGTFAHINSGSLRAVAVASEKRSSFLPNIPTFRELGMDVVISHWRGLAAPAGTPEAVQEVLEKACGEAAKKPEFIEDFRKINLEIDFKGRKAFAQMIAEDLKKFKEVMEQIKKSK